MNIRGRQIIIYSDIQTVLKAIAKKFRAQLRTMNIGTESKCKYCDEDETAKHIMCVCNAYAALRQRTTGMMYCTVS